MADNSEHARVVLDIWGGYMSTTHMARFLPTIDDCWDIARREIEAGFLVNIRQEIAWGKLTPFDSRTGLIAGDEALQ